MEGLSTAVDVVTADDATTREVSKASFEAQLAALQKRETALLERLAARRSSGASGLFSSTRSRSPWSPGSEPGLLA